LIRHAGNESCAEGRMALEDVRVVAVEHRLDSQLLVGTGVGRLRAGKCLIARHDHKLVDASCHRRGPP